MTRPAGNATRRVRRPLALAPLAMLLPIVVLTGCSKPVDPPPLPAGIDLSSANAADGNGLWLRSGAAVTSIVADAVRRGGPVHIVGEITETVQPDPDSEPEAGRILSIDFQGTASSYVASVVAGDVRIEAVVSAEGSRVRGNDAFARENSGREAGAIVCSAGLDPALADLAPLLDPVELVGALLGAGGVGVNPPEEDADTLDVVTGEEGSVIGILTVERIGAPLPRAFVAADASGEGSLAFTDWGVPIDLDAAAEKLPCPDQ